MKVDFKLKSVAHAACKPTATQGDIQNGEKGLLASLRPSVLMEQLGSHWTDFNEISYLSIVRKYVMKIEVLLKSDKNNGYFT
jgi:hypothetical protein